MSVAADMKLNLGSTNSMRVPMPVQTASNLGLLRYVLLYMHQYRTYQS